MSESSSLTDNQAASANERVTAEVAHTGTRVAGAWLAIASVLFIVSLIAHPPPSPDLGEFMATIAGAPTQWVLAHWAAALALTGFAVTGLLVLTTSSRLAQEWWTMTAWAVLIVGALWVTTTAIAEATVITAAAVAGDTATFEAWQLYVEGRALGFGFLAIAIAVIAGNEARNTRSVMPEWAAWIGALAGIAAFVGFVVIGQWLGLPVGGFIWLVSTVVMSLWTLWFGIALIRANGFDSANEVTTESVG